MNRRELIPKVGRGVEGTNSVESPNQGSSFVRMIKSRFAIAVASVAFLTGAPNKSAEAVQPPTNVLQGDPSDSVVEGYYGPISSTNQTSLVNGKLVMSNNAVNYITSEIGLNGGASGGEFVDLNGNNVSIQGLNSTFTPFLHLPNASFGYSNVNGDAHTFFVDLIRNTSIDLTSQYGVFAVAAGFFANDNEVMIYAGQGKSSFKVNIYNNSIVAIPYNPTVEQKLQNSIDGRANIARLELGSQSISNAGFNLVSKTGISHAYHDSNRSIVLHDPEVEQVEAPAPVITLEDSYILNTNNQTLRFSVANFIAGDTVELEYLGLKITGLVANANGEVSYTFTEQDFKEECTGLLKVSVVRNGEEVASSESDLIVDMVAPMPLGVSIEGDDVVATDGGFKFEIDSSQSSVTRGVVFEKPMEMGSESTVSVAKISMDELEDIDLNDPNEVRTRLLSIMGNLPQVEELNDDDFDSNGKAVRNFEFSKGDFALVTITTDPAGNSSVSLNIINVVEKATGEDMGPVETDMGGNTNDPDMTDPDMTDPGKADQGGTPDLGTPSKPTSGSEDGPTCATVKLNGKNEKDPSDIVKVIGLMAAATLVRRRKDKNK